MVNSQRQSGQWWQSGKVIQSNTSTNTQRKPLLVLLPEKPQQILGKTKVLVVVNGISMRWSDRSDLEETYKSGRKYVISFHSTQTPTPILL
jgi:hypothetical protein